MTPAPIIDALIETLLFLEDSDDSVVNPNAAVRAIENIGACLQRLTPADRRELLDYINRLTPADHRHRALAMMQGVGLDPGT